MTRFAFSPNHETQRRYEGATCMFEAVILTVIPEFIPKDFDALLPLVSPDKQERIKQFHFFRDARNCLLGDILARVKICRFTNLSKRQIEFSVNEYGKPFVAGTPYTIQYFSCR